MVRSGEKWWSGEWKLVVGHIAHLLSKASVAHLLDQVQSKRRKLLHDMARNMELELNNADTGRVCLMRSLLDSDPLAQTAAWYNNDSNLQTAVESALRIKQVIA